MDYAGNIKDTDFIITSTVWHSKIRQLATYWYGCSRKMPPSCAGFCRLTTHYLSLMLAVMKNTLSQNPVYSAVAFQSSDSFPDGCLMRACISRTG
jgi:hypothetical protein